MSSNQPPPPHRNDADQQQVPSWDEFNMLAHEDEDDLNEGYLLDGPEVEEEREDDIEVVNEPGQPEEFGPTLPPGFGGEDSHGEQPQLTGSEAINDFYIPVENYDLDDPEDPLQCSSSSANNFVNQRNVATPIGPQVPNFSLPKIPAPSKGDEHLLPSFVNNSNANMDMPSTSASVDFIPSCDQAGNSSNNCSDAGAFLIGPTLPPDLNHISNPMPPTFNELDDIGPALPPDEPQSYSCSTSNNDNIITSRRQQIGPTLPCSSDEEGENEERDDDEVVVEEEEEEREEIEPNGDEEVSMLDNNSGEGNLVEQEMEERGRDCFLLGEGEREEEEEGGEGPEENGLVVGPMPPVSGRSEEEQQEEYLARLAEFEANKKEKAANGVKREEWMTELPQKMLKTGAFGLSTSKTSFSRSSAGPSSDNGSLWTNVPNKMSNGDASVHSDGNAPSTSKSTAQKQVKRSGKDEREERRAAELNSERTESLMDIHQKKLKLESGSNNDDNETGGKLLYSNNAERRPFNRDNELEIRGLGGAGGVDASALKERMGDLSNRFGHSSERKFL